MTLIRRSLLLAIFSLAFSATSSAQATAGTPQFGAFGGGPADVVNLGNLNVHIDMAVVRKAGRGVPFNYDITYDTSLWSLPTLGESSVWQPAGPPNWSFGWFFPVQGGLQLIIASESFCGSPYPNGARVGLSITYYDPLGTPHPLPGGILVSSGSCGNSSVFYGGGVAADGSGYVLSGDSSADIKVTAKDGKVVFWANSSGNYIQPVATDDNGNEVTVSASNSIFTDTLGVAMMTLGGSGTPSSPKTFTYPTPPGNGSSTAYTLKYAAYTVKTNFGCSGISEYGPIAQNLPSELDLPDGSKYTFTYEPTPGYSGDYTGRLASVTLPTGGTITYTYTGSHNGIVCTDGSVAGLTRQTPDGTWTYSRTINGGAASTTTITDPQNNQTLLNFVGIYPTETQVYQGSTSGTLLETTLTCYNGSTPTGSPATCNSASITLPITENTAYLQWPNGSNFLESKVDTLYDKEIVGSTTNSNGLVTEVDEYDYGTNAPGSLLRKTTTTYASLTNNIVNRPYQVTVKDGSGNTKAQTTYTYDGTAVVSSGITTQHVSVSGSRGNPTQVSSLVTPSTSVNQNFTYFDTGLVNVAYDGKGNSTTYAYSSTYQGGYPTTITNALNQITTVAYDINSGLVTSQTDANNQPTSYSYDLMFRPTQVNYPDGGQKTFTYYFYQNLFTTYFTQKMNTSVTTNGDMQLDGLGRQIRVATLSGETQAYNETQNTCFNSNGLVSLQGYAFQDNGWNNPINCSVSGDSYTYDALGRPTRIAHADGSQGTISFTGNCATATDEQGKQRTVCTDGLGRVASVVENPGGLNYSTTYAYDVLNNLTTVTQGAETRAFAYDDLSRLTGTTNPESGTTSYTYDADSNVLTRIDARNITTTYSYDALNRLTGKTYSDGTTPTAHFVYDTNVGWNVSQNNVIGRMSEAYIQNPSLVATIFSYDPVGRATLNNQCDTGICPAGTGLAVGYTYDLIGDMTSYTNGAGVTFTQSFNAASRPTQLTSSWNDSQHPATLVSAAHYNGAGGITSYVLGNNLMETVAYNGLVQPCRMNVNSSGTLLGSCTASVPSGNVLDLTTGFNYGSGDNGNVMSWAAVGQQTFNRSYTYDGVNRVYTMSAPGSTCSGLSWSYDQWGNRTGQNVTGGTCGSSQLTFNSFNHVTNSGFQYDAAGNMTHDASHSYTYDAENRITKVDGGSTATYGYDADGRRVSRVVAGVETDYIYDLSGHVVATYGGGCGNTCWNTGFVYLNGQMLAEYYGTTYFITADHLGSTRLLTGYPTASVVECDDYYPFGEQVSCAGTSTTTHKFTGYERDAESGLDNAQARYNSSSLGRFMSPDPIGNFVADATNPQTWNMYAYVNNNPLAFVDPTGLCGEDTVITTGTDPDTGLPTIMSGPGQPCFDNFWFIVQYFGYGWVNSYGGGHYPSGGGGGGGGSPTVSGKSNLPSKLKAAVCKVAPEGQALTAGGTVGLHNSATGAIDLVTNYNTGLSNIYLTGGTQTGFNPVLSGNASAGYIFSAYPGSFSMTDYSGHFSTGQVSIPAFGGFWSASNNTVVTGFSTGASVFPLPSAGVSQTNTTQPLLGPKASLALSALVASANPSSVANTLFKAWCSGG